MTLPTSLPPQYMVETAEDIAVIETKEKLYHIRKILLCLGSVDLFLNLINGILMMNDFEYYFINFFLNVMIIFGLYGINKYNITYTNCYKYYNIVEIIGRCFVMFYLNINFYYFIVSIVSILINIYTIKLIINFGNELNKLNSEQIEDLNNNWRPLKREIIFI
jgi:hypothetical protein